MGTHIDESIRKRIEERYPTPDRTTYVPMITALRQAAEFGYQLAQEEPTQDELWEEVHGTIWVMGDLKTVEIIQNLKKRYRITRVK